MTLIVVAALVVIVSVLLGLSLLPEEKYGSEEGEDKTQVGVDVTDQMAQAIEENTGARTLSILEREVGGAAGAAQMIEDGEDLTDIYGIGGVRAAEIREAATSTGSQEADA